jgi:hypothetical protein
MVLFSFFRCTENVVLLPKNLKHYFHEIAQFESNIRREKKVQLVVGCVAQTSSLIG